MRRPFRRNRVPLSVLLAFLASVALLACGSESTPDGGGGGADVISDTGDAGGGEDIRTDGSDDDVGADGDDDAGADTGDDDVADAADTGDDAAPTDTADDTAAPDTDDDSGGTDDAASDADDAGDGSVTPPALCSMTGGEWDPASCGHYVCGIKPACEAIIPGCDCGAGRVYDEVDGCVVEAACGDDPSGQALCEETGGRWDDGSCGHYICGERPTCRALIPGCDCGDGEIFDEEMGCRADDRCDAESEQELCEVSGGTWDPTSCGHWECGVEPACDAIIPGCNCGDAEIFDPARGCVESAVCGGASLDRLLCGATGGTWRTDTCGHLVCGEDVTDCEAPFPGCDCGELRTFVDEIGCQRDADCGPAGEEALCVATGGSWDETSCGHWACGEEPLCEAIIPGCNCGEGRSFDSVEGCFEDADCGGSTGAALCAETGGTWLETTCGHWECGLEPDCDAVIPGCNCGRGRSFDERAGCALDRACIDGTSDETLCDTTGGHWDETSCGHYRCGTEPACDAIRPGCDCGDFRNFRPEVGCNDDPNCGDPEEREECEETGGRWVIDSCGHYLCGAPPPILCLVPEAGCDCGSGETYKAGAGCTEDPDCGGEEKSDAELCETSGGRWDPMSCGDYFCGAPPLCLAIIPGCDCGAGENFVDGVGCQRDSACPSTEDCPDPDDPDVRYVSADPEMCARIRFTCEDDERAFSNECGCGCIRGE